MKSSSAKAKGRRLQQWVRDQLYELFPHLRKDDIRSITMGESGEDIPLSPAARNSIPYAFECKNQESLNFWKAFDQAEKNSGDRNPILIVKRNRTEPKVMMSWATFAKLIQPK